MKDCVRPWPWLFPALALFATVALPTGCALFRKRPEPTDPAAAGGPVRVTAPHPESMEYKDIRSLFLRAGAPAASELDRCDFDYQVERRLTPSKEGLFTTFPAHVKANPDFFHWCFYGRLLRILELARDPDQAEAAKKLVIDDYPFLTHLARIFQADFYDVRYLRTAIYHYGLLSKQLFYSRTVPNERTQGQLMDATFPDGLPTPDASPSPSP